MRLKAAIVLLLCVASQPALAQSAGTPMMGSQATAEQPAAGEVNELTRMLVLGDAVGGGLGAGLERMTQALGRFDVSIRFNEESGLARPDVYDWAETVPKILETSSYDVVVVLMGANDRQMIRSGILHYAFNTTDWITAYKAQVDKLLDQLAASGAKVYWVAIPPMADPQYDADLKVIAGLQRERVEARGFAYLDFSAQFSNPDGSYSDTGADETGSIRKLRGKDGISFFKAGNNKLAQLVLEAIETGKRDRPEPRAVVAVAVPAAPPEESVVPLFGQSLLLGGTLTVEPADIGVDALVVAGAGIVPSTAFQVLRDLTVTGSGAEKLLRRGEVAPAPTGRADDFSVPPETKSD